MQNNHSPHGEKDNLRTGALPVSQQLKEVAQ